MNAILSDVVFDIAKINAEIALDEKKALFDAEKTVDEEVEKTAEAVFESGAKVVLVSGRSASGKTTFTRKVCEKLLEMGREARHISLDDFLLGMGYMPINEDGTFDMESILGLDTALANKNIRLLIEEGKADFPTFDFTKQSRGEKWNRVELGKNGLVMIEGIHALNPLLTENIPQDAILRIFIEPKKEYVLNGKTVFDKRDIRLIRRMTRDELFRAWETEKTLIQWKSVLEGEKLYIEPYIELADIKVNSSVETEMAVFADVLPKMLSKIQKDSPYFKAAEDFCAKLLLFSKAEKENLPKDSLIREFVG